MAGGSGAAAVILTTPTESEQVCVCVRAWVCGWVGVFMHIEIDWYIP